MKSKFIIIEGLEGAGKTNAVSQVIDILHENGIDDVIFTHEPGGTPLAEILRTLIKHGVNNEEFITDHAELLMFYAARVQLLENVIKPALIRGTWVVSDRHDLSSQAYQGGGRGIDICFLKTLRDIILKDFYPDLTFYLDIPPEIGLSRVKTRGEMDRIEIESLDFFKRTRARYLTLAEKDNRIITVDASQSLSTVNCTIRILLTQWLRNKDVLS